MLRKGILVTNDDHLVIGNNPSYVNQGYFSCGVIVGTYYLDTECYAVVIWSNKSICNVDFWTCVLGVRVYYAWTFYE